MFVEKHLWDRVLQRAQGFYPPRLLFAPEQKVSEKARFATHQHRWLSKLEVTLKCNSNIASGSGKKRRHDKWKEEVEEVCVCGYLMHVNKPWMWFKGWSCQLPRPCKALLSYLDKPHGLVLWQIFSSSAPVFGMCPKGRQTIWQSSEPFSLSTEGFPSLGEPSAQVSVTHLKPFRKASVEAGSDVRRENDPVYSLPELKYWTTALPPDP